MILTDFIETFGTDKQCEDFLIERRWGKKENAVCPHCNCKKVYVRNARMMFRCSACKKNFSVKVGTLFEGSNIKLNKWFLAVYFISTAKKGMSSVELAEKLGVTQKTAWFISHRIRTACIDFGLIGGTVEVDATFVGGKEKNKHESKKLRQGRGTEGKNAVLGAISRQDKKVVAYPVSEESRDTTEVLITNRVEKGSMIYADNSSAYSGLVPLRVNHSKGEYVRGDIHTNGIESFWSTIKRGYVGIYHHWSKKHLAKYVNEFTYRFNHKNNKNKLSLISSIIDNTQGKSLTYNKLIGV